MSKLNANLKYIGVNGFILIMAVLGILYDVQGAYYVTVFSITVLGLLGILSLFAWEEVQKEYVKQAKLRFAGWRFVDGVYDMFFLTMLVWNGHFYLGVMYLISVLISLALAEGAKEA